MKRDYGFVTTSDGRELYFHRNSVMDAPFEALRIGDAVEFIEAAGDTGPTAAKIWRVIAATAEKRSPRGRASESRR